MTNTAAGEKLLKMDSKGRMQFLPEQRQKLLEEFAHSGLSAARFAKVAGVKYQTFTAWVARERKERGIVPTRAKTVDPVRWLETMVNEAKPVTTSSTTALKVRLSAGAWIELNHSEQVNLAAALVQALEKGSRSC